MNKRILVIGGVVTLIVIIAILVAVYIKKDKPKDSPNSVPSASETPDISSYPQSINVSKAELSGIPNYGNTIGQYDLVAVLDGGNLLIYRKDEYGRLLGIDKKNNQFKVTSEKTYLESGKTLSQMNRSDWSALGSFFSGPLGGTDNFVYTESGIMSRLKGLIGY